MWVYERTEPGLWTVGFYAPDGTWNTDSDHSSKDAAADRAAYLNGGGRVIDEPWDDPLDGHRHDWVPDDRCVRCGVRRDMPDRIGRSE